jgi:Zn-dependent protease
LAILLVYGRLFTLFGAAELIGVATSGSNIIVSFRFMFALINVALAVFNMLPLPPLDGFRIIKFVFPKFAQFFQRIDPFTLLIILFLILQT